MSGNVIRLIPEGNYKLIPAPHIIRNLRSLLDDRSIFCDIHVFDSVQFIDQGGNFEYVACPFCSGILDVAWWQEEMSMEGHLGCKLRVVKARY